MSLSANANEAYEGGPRVLRGVTIGTSATTLTDQLEECSPGDPNAVDPRLRDRSIEEGRRIGFEKGFEEGMLAAQAQLNELKNAKRSLIDAANQFNQREIDLLNVAEQETLDAVFLLAQAVLQHEVSVADNPGREAITRALGFAPNGAGATAYLNPVDAEKFETPEIETEGRTVRIVADPRVETGGCILEIGPTRIDTQIHVALERMREVL